MTTDFLSLADLTEGEILDLLDLADDLKKRLKADKEHRPLRGQTLALIFEKPSLRTRVTFETGIFQLGGNAVFLETTLGKREAVPDVARNLERWVDGIVARTHGHDAVMELAEHASVPVINALTDKFHPCQVLADAQTLREHRGKLDGLSVAFVGDGNNMFASWANLATRIPINLTLVCPEGYEPEADVDAYARENVRGTYRICHDVENGVRGADVVYTDVWTSMGQEDEAEKRRKVFQPYRVDAAMMALAKRDALFMHCLPAHRGEEVTGEVIEGPQSVVFDEAENRLHAQKAVMATLLSEA